MAMSTCKQAACSTRLTSGAGAIVGCATVAETAMMAYPSAAERLKLTRAFEEPT